MTQPLSEGFYPLQQDVLDKQIREPKPLTDKLQLIEEQPPAGALQMPDALDLYAARTESSPSLEAVYDPELWRAFQEDRTNNPAASEQSHFSRLWNSAKHANTIMATSTEIFPEF